MRAASLLDDAQTAFGDDPAFRLHRAALHRLRAVDAILAEHDPLPDLTRARAELEAVKTLSVDRIEHALQHAMLANVEHAWRISAGEFDDAVFMADQATLDENLAALPNVLLLQVQRGELLVMVGLAEASPLSQVAKDELVRAGRSDLRSAAEGNPFIVRRLDALAARRSLSPIASLVISNR